MWEVMKIVLKCLVATLAIASGVFLYTRQLGAIPCFLLAIYCFALGYKQITLIKKEKNG